MGPMQYPHEKFLQAVGVLATSSRSIQQRLEYASTSFISVKREDMEAYPDVIAAYDAMYQVMTANKGTDEGYIPATVRRMSDEEAERAAEMIFELYALISRIRQG